MGVFEALFRESKGQPIVYNGRKLYLVDLLPCTQGDAFRVTIESTDSEWRQGVMLRAPGPITVAGRRIRGPVVLWEDTAPTVSDIRIRAAKGPLEIKNVWDTGNGVVQSWHNGAAMMIEEVPSGRRYRCNDGHPDEDFDDIVFRVEKVAET
jgi:hypothetical protein